MSSVVQTPSDSASQQALRRRPVRPRPVNQGGISSITVSSRNASPLQGNELTDLAHVFSRLEDQVLSLVEGTLQNETVEDDSRRPGEQQRLIQIEFVRRDIQDILAGRYQFSATYLKGRDFLEEWDLCAIIFRELFRTGVEFERPANTQIAVTLAKRLETLALPLPAALELAARGGALDVLTKNTIGDKYRQLDIIVDLLCEYSEHTRSLPTWETVSRSITELSPSAPWLPTGVARLSVILWMTFFVTVVSGALMLTFAWNHSEHQPGRWDEEDFFFLIQGSVTQIFSLIVSVITLWRSKTVPVAAWALPGIFATVSTLASVGLYCFVPKWWSSFCTTMAASSQAFMVFQLALYGV